MSKFGAQLSAALSDFIQGLRMAPIWLSLGWDQTVGRFRRTLLGPFWLSSGVLAMAFALSFVFGGLFGATDWKTNLQVVLVGILCWSVVGGPIGDSTTTFVGGASLMQLQRLPVSFLVFLQMFRSVVNFATQIIVIWIVLLFLRLAPLPNPLVLPAFALVLFNSFMLSIIIGFPSTRFRDVGYAVGVGMSILFFCTPVFWRLEQMSPNRRFIVALNPLAHEVEVLRKPLLGQMPALIDWEWTIGTAIVTCLLAIITLALYRRRLIFWL